DDPKYIGDPLNAIRIFNEKEVDELLFVDITASVEGRPPRFDYLRDVVGECFMPLCYGGGITSLDDIDRLFRLGMEKVSLNTSAHGQPELVRAAVRRFGAQSIVASIDVRKGRWGGHRVCLRRGKQKLREDPVTCAKRMADLGVGEILLNSIDRDGMQQGYDLALIESVAHAVDIPIIALGGAGKVADFGEAIRSGASAVAAGSLFVFVGRHRAVLITYPDQEEIGHVLREPAPAR
ncbi:MAG: HisA/HisF-related TIM barrel protein, partial [Planctomycetota bacterium]